MIFLIVRLRYRVQGSDWPALDNIERIANQTPFDVLGAAKMRFDPSADALKLHDLRIGQHLFVLQLRLDLPFFRTAVRRGINRQFLGGYPFVDDLAVPHLVDISIHPAGNHGFTQPEAGINGYHSPVGSDGIGSEQNACCLGKNHLLNHHSQVDVTMVEAVLQAIHDCSLGEQRCPAPADMRQDRFRSANVEIRILLAGKGCRWQILGSCAGPYRVGAFLPKPGEEISDLFADLLRNG